jgi:hypothetical protein
VRKCPACGQENLFDGAAFCKDCGADLNQPTSEQSGNTPSLKDSAFEIDDLDTDQSAHEYDDKETVKNPVKGHDDSDGLQITSYSSDIEGATASRETDDPPAVNGTSEGTREVDLGMDDTDGDESNDSEEQQSTDDQDSVSGRTDAPSSALADDQRSRLIEDLQSKLNTMAKPKTPAIDESKPKGEESDWTGINEAEDSPTINGGSEEDGAASNEDLADLSRPVTRDKKMDFSRPNSGTVVRATGHNLRFPAGTKFSDGELIQYKDRSFRVENKPRNERTLLIYGVLATAVAAILVVLLTWNTGHVQMSSIVGVVTQGNDGTTVSGATVTLVELNKSVKTDLAGLFVFAMVPDGAYTLRAETADSQMTTKALIHEEDRQSLVGLNVQAPRPERADKKKGSDKGEVKAQSPKETVYYGTIGIKSNVPDAEIVLDNTSYGTKRKKIDRVREGNHKLVVRREGYEPAEEIVSVSREKTTDVVINLVKLPEEKPTPPTASDHVRAGDLAMKEGRYQAAVTNYNFALELENSVEVLLKRAKAYKAVGDAEKSRDDYFRAGNLLASDGQVSDAIAAFSEIIKSSTSDMPALRARGYTYIQRGEYELALADFRAACDVDDDVYENLIGLGDAFSVLGRYKDAVDAYKDAEKRTDDKAPAYALIALASLSRGKENDARKYYEKFVKEAEPEDEQRYATNPDWQRLKQLASSD